jgi:hypothetical protein
MKSKVSIAIIFIFAMTACDNMTQKEFFDKVVNDEYHAKYSGIVIDKYIDEGNHLRRIVELKHDIFGIDKRDFTFQSLDFFDFIKVGDTLIKDSKSVKVEIKRMDLDTIIYLDFGNLKGHEIYKRENPYLVEKENQ